MIAASESNTVESCESASELLAEPALTRVVLVRYGRVPQVARFGCGDEFCGLQRADEVVVSTERGEECGSVLHVAVRNVGQVEEDQGLTGRVLRLAGGEDLERLRVQQAECDAAYGEWLSRAAQWNLQLQLIDLERTLDGKLILYVLNDRGAETTRLALLAAAAGHGIVHVQPVAAEGIVPEKRGGGCGDCGCSTH
ncbi:MAG: hypothetical protein RL215_712 [Planctomycetota bacterium]|jgi:hypothetical protein